MALWFCSGCTAAYSVGAARCPQCGSTEHTEEQDMPKITVHGGPSNEHTDVTELAEPGPDTVLDPANITVSVDGVDAGPGEAGETEPGDNRELYEAETVDDLKVELEARGLAKSGNKAELVDRLVEADATTTVNAGVATGTGEAPEPA